MSTPEASTPNARLELRRRKRRRLQMLGLSLMAGGLLALAVPPDAEYGTVLVRVTLGFALLVGGLFAALLPLLTQAIGLGED